MNNMYIFFKNIIYVAFAYFMWTKGLLGSLNAKLLEYSGLTIENQESEPIKKKPLLYEDKYLEEYEKLERTELSEDQIKDLANNFIMEFTPVGNVIMQYDHKKESFLYYSDSVIPFRYLEPIGRKYVTVFNCKQLFINMKEEIEKSKTQQSTISNQPAKPVKTKDILNKLKTPTTAKPIAPPPSKAKIQINRYTSMGRFSNFKMLKQVDRKIVDKNYSISFSDFKKMTANKTSI